MSLATGLLVYAILWWLVFFMVLPFGVRAPHEVGEEAVPGTPESAPVRPRLWLKTAVTTGLSAVLWGAVYLVARYDVLGFRDLVTP